MENNVLNTNQFPEKDIFKCLNDNTIEWKCVLLPRFLYEILDDEGISEFKSVLSGLYNTHGPLTYSKVVKLDSIHKNILEGYMCARSDPYTGIQHYSGYLSEMTSSPIEDMFYMRKQITYESDEGVFHGDISCRCKLTSVMYSIGDDNYTISIQVYNIRS